MLEIRLLGQFTLKSEGQLLNLSSRRAQSLLAFLLLNPGIQHRRERLAGQLWPEADEKKARDRLRYSLWQLRGTLGSQYIAADRIMVSFKTGEEYSLDLAEFKLDRPETADTKDLKEALSFYQGELLPGFYQDWVVLERRRFEALFDRQIQLLNQLLLSRKKWREVVEWCERWIALGQPSETAYRYMMIALSQLGEISQAANAYQRCVRDMADLFAVEPSARTKQVFDQISRGEKADPATSDDLRPEIGVDEVQRPPEQVFNRVKFPSEKEAIPFVGREEQIILLQEKLKRALLGEGQIAAISGTAGRGKSSLIREFSRLMQQDQTDLVIAYGCGEARVGAGDPHLPFRDILRQLCGDAEASRADGKLSGLNAERLWELIPISVSALLDQGPDLLDTFVAGDSLLQRARAFSPAREPWLERLEHLVDKIQGRPIPLYVEHSDTQSDLFEQYTRVLWQISDEKPLILILDDFHWADTGSLNLLFHLARRISGKRIFAVFLYRLEEIRRGRQGKQHPLEPILSELRRNFGDIEINLDQIDEEHGKALVDALVDIEPNDLDESFRLALYHHTGGHPLFTLELIQQLKDQRDLVTDGRDLWSEGEEISWQHLPSKVEAIIESRINRLPADLRSVLNAASVEGEEFSAEVIARTINRPVAKVISSLSQALDRQHLLIKAVGINQIGQSRFSRYTFRHHLFQKYLYDSLDDVERSFLHEQVGLNLEELYGRQKSRITTRLAWHFECAGDLFKAVEYLYQAGEQAKKVSANRQSIDHFRKAIGLLEQMDDDSMRRLMELKLQIGIGAPTVALNGWASPEAERAYERAKVLCDRTGEYEQLAPALWGLWSYYLVRAKFSEAKELALQLGALAKDKEDSTLQLVANWTLGITLAHLGELRKARYHLEQALLQYDDDQHEALTYLYGQNPRVTCSCYLAIALWIMGYPDQSLERGRLSQQFAEQGDHLFSLAFAHGMLAIFQAFRREPEAAHQHAKLAIKNASEGQFPFLFGLGLIVRGWAMGKLGLSKTASKLILRGLSAMKETGADLGRSIFLALAAETLENEGETEEALDLLHEAIAISSVGGDRLNEAELYRLKGSFQEKQGAGIPEIAEAYKMAADIANKQGARLFELRSQLAIARLDIDKETGLDGRIKASEILEGFPDGFDTIDLKSAQDILHGG